MIAADGSDKFTGLEFTIGTGFSGDNYIRWEAYDNGSLVGYGLRTAEWGPSVIGFRDDTGFDTLRFTSSNTGDVNFSSSYNAPAFDSVRAQFTANPNPVPEPETWLLMGTGLIGLLGYNWRWRNA